MNFGVGVGSGSVCSSTGVRMAAIPDQFPAGLRVLVVDDDPTCLKILQKMLQKCAYEVTISNRADKALSLLRGKSSEYDIVISDVHMPDMDGFKLLEYIGLEMDLPVIMMSADDGQSVVFKGVTHGACDYLIKPVRIEALKNIWQHVVRKKKNEFKELEPSGSANDVDRQQGPSEDADCSPMANEGNWKNAKRKKDEEDEVEDKDDTSSLKKARVVWSAELHQLFVVAVNQLGIEKAVPKKILELMNIPGLTRENVASHLQKYRLYLRRLNEQTQQQNGLTNSYISAHEAAFGQMHVQAAQAFAAAGHLPPESLATLQGLSRPNAKSGLPMPLVDQRNLFSFETPKLRFEEAQQQKLGNSSKPMNLLFGIPTTMEPQQLSNLHHSNQTFGAVNLQVSTHGSHTGPSTMQLGQSESRGQIQNETSTRGLTSRATLSMPPPPPISSNGITSGALTKDTSVGDNLVSQAHSMVDLPLNHSAELSGNSFLLGSNTGLPVLKSRAIFHQEVSTNMFNELHERKSQNWELQGLGLNFGGPQHTNLLHDSLDSLPSVITHQGFISGQMKGHNSNAICIDGPVFVPSTDFGDMNSRNAGQHLDTLFVDSSSRIKAESVPNSSCGDAIFHENFSHEDDLMSAFLKQKGGIRTTDNELDIDDGFSLDNIPA